MNEKQLRSFMRSAELGSFAKAAKEASVSSPSLIGQINTLEKEYGFPLFKRSTHAIELTPQGQILYDAGKQMVDVYKDFRRKVNGEPEPKVLNITTSGMQTGELNDFGRQFEESHPDINIRFKSAPDGKTEVDIENTPDKKSQIYFSNDPNFMGGMGIADSEIGIVIGKDADMTTLQFITDLIAQIKQQKNEGDKS